MQLSKYLFRMVLAVVLIGFTGRAVAPAFATFADPQLVNLSKSVSTAAEIIPADRNRRYLLIQNVCASNIGISPTGTTPAIGTAGTVTLLPGGSLELTGVNVPHNAINAISASGTCGITIWEIR